MNDFPNATGLRMLLVEPSLVTQKLAVLLLEEHEHSVTVANNGQEALAALEKNRVDRVDLVLMRLQLPDMDGFEVTTVIRAKEKGTESACPGCRDDVRYRCARGSPGACRQAGMDGCIGIPDAADLDWWLERLERLVTRLLVRNQQLGKANSELLRLLRTGQTLGNYELLEQLGQGGMGTVYRARHTLLMREVASKCSQPSA